jgi:hypothetical protein
MSADTPTILGIVTVTVLCVVAVSIGMFENGMFFPEGNIGIMESDTGRQLDEINKIAITHFKKKDTEKVNEQRVLMKEKLQKIASDSFGINITKVNLENNYFPFLPASELKLVDPESTKPICDFSSNIPIQLQKIPDTDMFQLFMEKYSKFSIEIDVQDERRHDSNVHYGIRSISDDGNYSAGMYVHADSCNGEMLSRYFILCYDKTKEELMMANTKERVLSSLKPEEFCIVPLDS